MVADPTRLLTVSQVAKAIGCDRVTAWRLLTSLERENGVKLIRHNRTILVDSDAVSRIVAAQPRRNERRMGQQIGSLRRRVAELEEWKKSTESELREFRRIAHEWMTKKV